MAEPLTAERLAEIRERTENATPGPWRVGGGTDIGLDIEPTEYGYTYSVILAKATDDEDRELDLWRPDPADRREVASAEDDALFIAHARQDVVDLLAEVDHLYRGMHDLHSRWIQRTHDNGGYYNRTAEKYEHGKAVAFDAAAEEIRTLIGDDGGGSHD